MTDTQFRIALVGLAATFTAFFAAVVVPALVAEPDVPAAFAAGFVNPFSSGYSVDVVVTWCILAVWVLHERRSSGTRWGWLALVLGLVPGVAVGFAAYLLLRGRSVEQAPATVGRAA